jgi:putative selenium metabolism hydrolase
MLVEWSVSTMGKFIDVDKLKKMRGEISIKTAELLSELIRIPSMSCAESRVVNHIATDMERLGFDEVSIDGFGNVIGRIGNGPRLLAYDAHVDTVDVGVRDQWTFDPFAGDSVEGRIRGRGAADQKAGMASMLYAGYLIKTFNLLPNEFTLLMVGSVSEEDCDGLCWRYIIEQTGIRPETVLLTEPTSCNLYRGQRGRMEIVATMPGISAHGSAPERGRNAVIEMAPIISGIDQLSGRLHFDEFLGSGSITISRIRSTAPSLCSVADSCELYLDRRLTWGETPEKALREIRDLDKSGRLNVKTAGYDKPTHTGFKYPVESIFPAWKTPDGHPSVIAGKSALMRLQDHPVRTGCWTFSTNGVAISGLHRIPCIGFGPGDECMAHAPNESVAMSDLVAAALFYALYPFEYQHTFPEQTIVEDSVQR